MTSTKQTPKELATNPVAPTPNPGADHPEAVATTSDEAAGGAPPTIPGNPHQAAAPTDDTDKAPDNTLTRELSRHQTAVLTTLAGHIRELTHKDICTLLHVAENTSEAEELVTFVRNLLARAVTADNAVPDAPLDEFAQVSPFSFPSCDASFRAFGISSRAPLVDVHQGQGSLPCGGASRVHRQPDHRGGERV